MKKQVFIWTSLFMLISHVCETPPPPGTESVDAGERIMMSAINHVDIQPDDSTAKELMEQTEYYIPGYKADDDRQLINKRDIWKADRVSLSEDRFDEIDRRGFMREPCIRRPAPLLQVHFDNDIYTNTDYYYTSGLELSFFHPALAHMPGASLLIGGGKGSIEHYGIRLIQNLYTPIDPDQYEVQYGDRPFAAYLTLGVEKISLFPEKSLRVTSGIDVGVIGPGALGGFVQKTVHQKEPVGWDNQVSNDMVVSYRLAVEKGLLIRNGIELWLATSAIAGTLYDQVSGGFKMKAGVFEVSSSTLSLAEGTACRKLQFYFSAGLQNKLVFYDATLQGGIFNNTSVYTILPQDMNRYVAEATLGLGFAYGRMGLHLLQHFNSPEFKGARSHSWGRITLEYRL